MTSEYKIVPSCGSFAIKRKVNVGPFSWWSRIDWAAPHPITFLTVAASRSFIEKAESVRLKYQDQVNLLKEGE